MAATQTNPMIAISVAAGGSRGGGGGATSRSSASCASSTWSVAAAANSPAQSIQLDHSLNDLQGLTSKKPVDGSKKRQCDAKLSVSNKRNQKEAALTSSNERLGHTPDTTRDFDDDNNAQQQQAKGLANVDEVRDNFIALIRYNKLQYFYIGAIIYSVINLLFFIVSLLAVLPGAGQQVQDVGPLDWPGGSCRQVVIRNQLVDNQMQPTISWLMILLIVVVNLMLASIVAFTLIEFNSMDWRRTSSSSSSRNNIRSDTTTTMWLLQCLGISLATCLLVMPIEIIYVKNVAQSYSNISLVDCHEPADEQEEPTRTPQWATTISGLIANCRLPVAAIGALLYSLPLLLERAPLLAKLTCSLLILPAVLVVPLEYFLIKQQQQPIPSISDPNKQPSSSSAGIFVSNQETTTTSTTFLGFSIFYLLLSLLAGLLKRHKLIDFVKRQTFGGASELIEAKVSLEQQRQQQETLLLSVLPAYVAEQVKRNMVKKMASVEEQSSVVVNNNSNLAAGQGQSIAEVQLITPGYTTVTSLAAPNQQQVSLQTSAPITTTTTASPARPSFVPLEAKTSNLSGASLSTRNSFIKSSSKFLGDLSAALKGHHHHHHQSSPTNNHLANQNNNINSLQQQQQQQQQANHLLFAPNQSQLSIQSNINLSATGSCSSQARRGFNELYIRTYNNVSLLYGDIVGFTRLCTQLSSSQLVGVLNDLFSHFDHLAERHKIMRIKILGDCYYGVSGIPEFAVMGAKSRAKSNDNHAINCVNMGLDMIQYIKCLNIERSSTSDLGAGSNCGDPHLTTTTSSLSHSVSATDQTMTRQCLPSSQLDPHQQQLSTPGERQQHKTTGSCSVLSAGAAQLASMPAFELNMRIGIHTGHIHSGVIGLKKWQFDVWSNDVSIAMHCESSGVAGRVQVTEATVQHLHGSFTLESAPRSDRDPYLADKDIRTYLIRERVQSSLAPSLGILNQSPSPEVRGASKRHQQQSKKDQLAGPTNETLEMDEEKIREATIGTIRQTLLAGEAANASSMNAYGLALDHNDMSPIGLQFNEASLEKHYHKRLVSSGSVLFELLVLFLLVGLVVASIDIQLGGSFARQHQRLLIVLVVVIALLLVCYLLLPQQHSHLDKSRRESKRGSSVLTKGLDIVVDNATNPKRHEFYKPPKSRNSLDFIKKSALLDHFRLSFRSVCRPVSRFACLLRGRQRQVYGNKLSPALGLILFTVVILVQVYLLSGQYCHQLQVEDAAEVTQDEKATTTSFLVEQYQLTVIILIIALDSSTNLLTYKRKYKLLLGLVFFQVIVLAFNLSPAATRQSQLVQSVCLFVLNNPNSTSDSWPARQDNQWGRTSNQQFVYWSSDALLLVLALWSLAFNRQLDYSSRANFLWRQRLNVDHEELEYISGINKVLLENILPSHVVHHYLTNPSEQVRSQFASIGRNLRMSFSNMRNLHDELYHEQHESVAVMFASIPHFYEFYDESDISKQGLGCIALLNEIICDFDKLLLKNKFSRIEKIKTIGSTYMAAAGLRPNTNMPGVSSCSLSHRNSAVSQISQGSSSAGGHAVMTSLAPALDLHHDNHLLVTTAPSAAPASAPTTPDELRRHQLGQQKMNLICMIQFASSLMTALNGINKQSFQVFKLRVGVNTGPVIAGVIGAQRPFYDIWGDCVNVSSLDSRLFSHRPKY